MKDIKKDKLVVCLDLYHKRDKVRVKDLSFRPAVYGALIERGKIFS